MKKTKLTRSLLAAVSIVAVSAVMYGCSSGPSQSELDAATERAAVAEAAAAAAAEAEAAAAAAAAEAEAAAAAAAAEAEAAAAAAAAEAEAAAAAAAAEAEAAAAAAAAEAEAAAAAAAAEAEAAAAAAAEAQEEIDARDAAAASATAAALKAALGAAPLNNLTPLTAAEPAGAPAGSAVVPSLTPAGLMLGMSARAADGSPNTDSLVAATAAGTITGAARTPRMAPGDSAGMLGDWAGTDYAHTSALTGVNNSARAYRNNTADVMIPFAAGASFGADEAAFEAAYTRATRTLALGTDPAASFDIAADMFPTAGVSTYTDGTTAGAVQSVVIPGTYQGAPGDFYCSGTTACSATVTATGAIDLAGTWHFIHDEGAMVTHPDPNYLYFGWWLQKDGTGTPDNVGAFMGMAGTATFTTADLSTAVTGSATYAGPAAGKFAISNPIGADDAGHFTADAMLTATFGANDAPNNGGVSGMLDNFMVNDEPQESDEAWSVPPSGSGTRGRDGGSTSSTRGRSRMV